eukprot:359139-Chlamydomonas_euryale.AAC.10
MAGCAVGFECQKGHAVASLTSSMHAIHADVHMQHPGDFHACMRMEAKAYRLHGCTRADAKAYRLHACTRAGVKAYRLHACTRVDVEAYRLHACSVR